MCGFLLSLRSDKNFFFYLSQKTLSLLRNWSCSGQDISHYISVNSKAKTSSSLSSGQVHGWQLLTPGEESVVIEYQLCVRSLPLQLLGFCFRPNTEDRDYEKKELLLYDWELPALCIWWVLKLRLWKFPGGPVVRSRCVHTAESPGSIPGQGTKIPQATWHAPPKEKIKPRLCMGLYQVAWKCL